MQIPGSTHPASEGFRALNPVEGEHGVTRHAEGVFPTKTLQNDATSSWSAGNTISVSEAVREGVIPLPF